MSTPRRFLPALLLLFVGSGCAALIYEVIWFQLLQLVIGASALSMGVLLGTFMGGMCLGSFLLPRYVRRGLHPLRVYSYLELGIGVFGLLILVGMPLVNTIYAAISPGSGVVGIALRAIAAAICLLPPTLLMGATLPAISRWVESTPEGVSWLGFFYGGNIAGGVLGSLFAGFYLLRVYDLNIATFVASVSTSPWRCWRSRLRSRRRRWKCSRRITTFSRRPRARGSGRSTSPSRSRA
jgi:spermidine synthase